MYKENYFKESVYLEVSKSKICRMNQQTRDPGRANVEFQVQRLSPGRTPSCSRDGQYLVLLKPPTDWIRSIRVTLWVTTYLT